MSRPLDAAERAARQRYLLVHPADDLRLAPNTGFWAPVQDWLDAGEPRSQDCPCAACRARWSRQN